MLTRNLVLCNSKICFLLFNLHVIGRKVNHQAGIFNANSKTSNSIKVFKDFFCLNFNIQYGSCPPGRGMFYLTAAGHASLWSVVGCFRGEKPPLREVGPTEQSQRDLRPLAQPTSRPSAAPKTISRPPHTQFFIPVCLPNHTSANQVPTSLRS